MQRTTARDGLVGADDQRWIDPPTAARARQCPQAAPGHERL